jgi:multidrug efflux pump subunit AcrB
VIAFLSPGANAVETSNQINAFMKQAKKNFPAGIDYVVSYDSTRFVRASIQDVIFTLLAAVGLVILVVFIFLQNWRATLIPLLTVPVAVIGAIALFPLLGFSINITSMFGLVLSIGIVVDDAIVVVEAVQRNIDDGCAARSDHARHGASVRAGGGHRLHSGGGVHSRRVPGRDQRPDLPAVRADHRSFGAAVGVQRAVAQSGAQFAAA